MLPDNWRWDAAQCNRRGGRRAARHNGALRPAARGRPPTCAVGTNAGRAVESRVLNLPSAGGGQSQNLGWLVVCSTGKVGVETWTDFPDREDQTDQFVDPFQVCHPNVNSTDTLSQVSPAPSTVCCSREPPLPDTVLPGLPPPSQMVRARCNPTPDKTALPRSRTRTITVSHLKSGACMPAVKC